MKVTASIVVALAASPIVNATVFLATRSSPYGDLSQVSWYVYISPTLWIAYLILVPGACEDFFFLILELPAYLPYLPLRTNGTPDICSMYTKIRDGDGNPCDIDFIVDGYNGPFTFKGCGQGLSLEKNHVFNSNCRTSGQKQIKCADGAVIGTGPIFECF